MTDEKPTERHSHRGRWLTLGILVLLLVAIIVGWCAWTWHRLNDAPLPAASAGQTFVVKKGESLAGVSHHLASRGILDHAWDLRVLAHLRGVAGRIQAGEYRVPAHITAGGLLKKMVAGRVLMHAFTIVPGETFAQILATLEANPAFKHKLKRLNAAAVTTRLGHSGKKAEGRFFPQTYDYPRGTSDIRVLKRAWTARKKHLAAAWKTRASGIVLRDPYQALIVASIVEKETGVSSERPRVAGVFERRLKRGMALDADPTIIYGLGEVYHGTLTRADMAKDTPYNTYLHRGLPPTPICMPGTAAVAAALHPAHGTALYFVAKGDGTHVFSDTLAEQERMIRRYELHQANAPAASSGR
jgi:UPF0755 protein